MAVVSGECGVGSWAKENGGSGFGVSGMFGVSLT